MNRSYETRRAVGAKVAFLGLFVAALVAARLIVALRSAVVLSEPIRLTHAGLSVSMPDGNGWKSTGRWEYREKSLVLGSTFAPGLARPSGSARCRYVFTAKTTSPQIRFEQKRDEVGGTIVKTDQRQIGTVTVDWIHIQKRAVSFNMFFGTGKLPYNRQIEIEVRERTGEVGLAERVFRRITESLDLTDSPLLEAGSQIILEMKGRGLAGFLDNQNRQSLFLIKDARKRILGFTTNVLIDTGQSGRLKMQAAGLYYRRGLLGGEEVTFFQSDNRFEQFTWKRETIGVERKGTVVALDDAGILTVAKFGEQRQEHSYHTGAAAIPEILLEQLLGQMLASDKKEMIVDIIEADGDIIPTYVSGVEPEDITEQKEISYMMKLVPLDGRGFFQWMYLNDRKQIFKRVEREEEIYVFESVEAEDAALLFPERSEYILHSDKLKQYLGERE